MVTQNVAGKASMDKVMWSFATDHYEVEILKLARQGHGAAVRGVDASCTQDHPASDMTESVADKWQVSELQAVLYVRQPGSHYWKVAQISEPFVVMHAAGDPALDNASRFQLVREVIDAQRAEPSISRRAA